MHYHAGALDREEHPFDSKVGVALIANLTTQITERITGEGLKTSNMSAINAENSVVFKPERKPMPTSHPTTLVCVNHAGTWKLGKGNPPQPSFKKGGGKTAAVFGILHLPL